MTGTPTALLSADRSRLIDAWGRGAEALPDPRKSDATQVLAIRVNFRVNVLQAFQAAWETTQVAAKIGVAIHNPFDLASWIGIGVEAISAIHTVCSSLIERMGPIEYVTAVILSTFSSGVSEKELEAAVIGWLKDPQTREFAWYLAMSGEIVDRALDRTSNPKWLEKAIESLRQGGFVTGDSDNLKFVSRNWEIGWGGAG